MMGDAEADSPLSEAGEEDQRLVGAVQAYMAALESGKRPSRREWLVRYPDIAKELGQCLDGLAFVHSAAARMQSAGGGETEDAMHIPEGAVAKPLGDFRLIKEIGRGGMGVVYEAEQLSLGRKVAVKVLPFAAALDSRHLQRFRNEAQAAAQLHHTNIVPVYAVGCERSVHYYAMQLIEGHSLSSVIRQMGQLISPGLEPAELAETMPLRSGAGLWKEGEADEGGSAEDFVPTGRKREERAPSSLATLRSTSPATFYQSVAKLGEQAADAMDYAHQAGIVHRDIKPANLMLDVRGNLWVTDFGLAQFYSGSEVTQTGDLVGTLAYMSPEQASGKAVVLDQRTDIYSLGVTLYELLTLRRAVAGGTREEILRQVSEEEPKPPRLIDKGIPRELEVIIQKASAKEPADRYQTARELAEDLRRFLEDEPILAKPPTTWEKAGKLLRKHRSMAMASLLVLSILATGFGLSTIWISTESYMTRQAERTERKALQNEQALRVAAKEQQAVAEKNLKEAQRAMSFFAGAAESEMADKPLLTDLRREFLEHALSYYQGVVDNASQSTKQELAAAQEHVSAILEELSATETYTRLFLRIRLLSESSVRQELRLTLAQITQCEKLLDQPPEDVMGYTQDQGVSSEVRRKHYNDLAQREEESIENILTVAQSDRLKQIAWQVRGPYVFSESFIGNELGLSDEQKLAIRQFLAGLRGGGPGGHHGLDHDREPGGDRERSASDVTAAIENQLTAGQLQKWKGIVGKPFTGYVESPYIFGMGPRFDHRGGPEDGFGHGSPPN